MSSQATRAPDRLPTKFHDTPIPFAVSRDMVWLHWRTTFDPSKNMSHKMWTSIYGPYRDIVVAPRVMNKLWENFIVGDQKFPTYGGDLFRKVVFTYPYRNPTAMVEAIFLICQPHPYHKSIAMCSESSDAYVQNVFQQIDTNMSKLRCTISQPPDELLQMESSMISAAGFDRVVQCNYDPFGQPDLEKFIKAADCDPRAAAALVIEITATFLLARAAKEMNISDFLANKVDGRQVVVAKPQGARGGGGHDIWHAALLFKEKDGVKDLGGENYLGQAILRAHEMICDQREGRQANQIERIESMGTSSEQDQKYYRSSA